MKTCSKCRAEKSPESFQKHRTKPDGLQPWCRDCQNAHMKREHHARPEVAARNSYYGAIGDRRQNPLPRDADWYGLFWAALRSAKSTSRKKGRIFDDTLRPEDLPRPDVCPLLGIPLDYKAPRGMGAKGRPDGLPSLDRKNSAEGYTRGNIWIISWRANRLKNNGTLEEFKSIVTNWPE